MEVIFMDKIFHFHQRNLIIQEIYKIFMIKCSNIKFLDIIGILQPFYKYPEVEIRISKVQELQCKSNDNPLLFNKLTQIYYYLEDFKQLLINCSLLEGIVIYTDNLYLNYCGDELLNILKEFSPINLHKLELVYCKFEIKSLDSFLNNWRNRRSLCLYSINTEYNHIDKFNDMIELYKKEGIIKKFKPDKNYNFMNDYKL
ncbi:unnamed protein product [Rhizophagus irregularis]|uniref:Uncharacterized protein n=1 Tax=Rhizophagus irregularis TaxID=588596 RepID=A0A915ZXF7_9GLOM|nr:unnamed protein product [Rhizophagus irregularis]